MIPAMNGKGLPRTGRTPPSPLCFLAACVLALAAALPASAFTFEPISQDFAPSGPGSVRSFRLENEGPDPVAVRVSVLTREVDAEGRESNAPADNLFVVYPSRAVLSPGSAQAVRVQWKGPADLKVELPYRILVEQLPVDFGSPQKQKGSIRVLFRYLGAAYIVPAGARPEVVVQSVTAASDSEGRRGAAVVLSNRGSAHAILAELTLTVSGGAGSAREEKTFGPEELPGLTGENVLAGTSRGRFLPLPEGFPMDDLHVAFSFEAAR
jgi:fimbrial chaperone protein